MSTIVTAACPRDGEAFACWSLKCLYNFICVQTYTKLSFNSSIIQWFLTYSPSTQKTLEVEHSKNSAHRTPYIYIYIIKNTSCCIYNTFYWHQYSQYRKLGHQSSYCAQYKYVVVCCMHGCWHYYVVSDQHLNTISIIRPTCHPIRFHLVLTV